MNAQAMTLSRSPIVDCPPGQIPNSDTISLAELMGALSYALDITEGQPAGHCIRACWIGTHIGQELGLTEQQRWELYYTLLLKDLGCSSNAARICEFYHADDLDYKKSFKTDAPNLTGTLGFVLDPNGSQTTMTQRLLALKNLLHHGNTISTELIRTRSVRGAAIAQQLRFPPTVSQGILSLDEHWDGSGYPDGLSGRAIPLYARIALLAQIVDIFYTNGDRQTAIREVLHRSNSWFDPEIVSAFIRVAKNVNFWNGLLAPDLEQRIFDLEPARERVPVDEDYLDDIAAAFGQVVDAKSPFTSGHSTRVAHYAVMMGQSLGFTGKELRSLRRGALLHDVGKLGVSNRILDKPGPLDDEEWKLMRDHAIHSQTILSRISVFRDMASKAAAHHERLDGSGYPHGLKDDEISLETRIITVADFFDALIASRPYRKAIPVEKALAIIKDEIGKGVDVRCFKALRIAIGPLETFYDRFGIFDPRSSSADTKIA